jgi:predicted HTH domain antitoxin
MRTKSIEVPEEILDLLHDSCLGQRPSEHQVRAALAIHLFLEGVISIGKAAQLADEPRVNFEWLLSQMGLPVVTYDVADYEQDLKAFSEAEHRSAS